MAKKDRERRSSGKLPQGKKFLVVVEGLVTESEYIEAVKRLRRVYRDSIKIETGHTDPIGIVNRAKELMRVACETDGYDEAWCVFDVEAKRDQKSRFGLQEAYDAAMRTRGKGRIRLAISNPCFEVWLLWHETNQTGSIASDTAQHLCKVRGITDGKHIRDADALIMNGFNDAKMRASDMEQTHERNGIKKLEDKNPSSSIYELIDAISAAFPPDL
jgi:hypothetical protein